MNGEDIARIITAIGDRDRKDREAFPRVQGRCPACGASSLFLGAGGYVTCSRLECPDPGAASVLLATDIARERRLEDRERRGA